MNIDKEAVALYAAGLSTVLLFIKIYEMWTARFRLDTYLAVDGPDEDKKVVLTNLSAKAVHITHFEMYWAADRWSKKNYIYKEYDLYENVQIGAYCVKTLLFREQDYFKLERDKKLFIKLYIAGKKYPKTQRLY